MKHLLIIFIILLSFFSINLVKSANHEELIIIAKALEDQHYTVKEWSIYNRSPIGEVKSAEAFYHEANEIQMQRKGYEWTSIEDANQHFKVVGMYKNEEEKYVHHVIITAIKYGENYKVEVANEVKGYEWKPKNINHILINVDYSSNGAASFYTVRGEANIHHIGEGELVKHAKKLMNHLSAVQVEQLVEDHFVSLSSLSSKWENKINVNTNEEMNTQIAMRFHPQDQKLNVTVGTPIITTEY